MRLVEAEFKAMNNSLRRFLQKYYEYPRFKRMGIKYEKNHDMLEIGCGSGYGAKLLSELNPKSYVGIDFMPEQIELAKILAEKNKLEGYDFRLGDASDLSGIGNASIDTVVIFGGYPSHRKLEKSHYRVRARFKKGWTNVHRRA